MKAVFDSNIVIDFLNQRPEPLSLFQYYKPVVSVITYVEVLAGAFSRNGVAATEKLFERLTVAPVEKEIAKLAAQIRFERKLKTPDALIYATAKHFGLILLTRNTKDFIEIDPQVKIPYKI